MASARAVPGGSPAPAHKSRRSPASWLSAYDDFITKNVGQVSQIESTLRSLTYVIPGRFRDAEIASEAIHSGVQLLSLYHDQLLLRTPPPPPPPAAAAAVAPSSSSSAAKLPPPRPLPLGPVRPPSQHTRYTRFWIDKSPFYRRVALVLQVVRYTELLCEMAAKRRGERLRWRVVVLIEAVKAICRLLLLRITGGRTLMSPPLPVRQPLPEGAEDEDEDDEVEGEGEDDAEDRGREQEQAQRAAQPAEKHSSSTDAAAAALQVAPVSPQPPLSPPPSPRQTTATTATMTTAPEARLPAAAPPSPPPTERQRSPPSPHTKGWAMPRTGMSLPPLPRPGDISAYLLSRVLTADDIKPATKLLNQLRGSAQVAEVLHILAPLVFAVALARSRSSSTTSSSSSSSKPSSRMVSWTPWLAGLAMECAARQLRDHSLRTTTLEREEWSRRGWAMGWWSMRGAFYEHVMKGVVGGVRARLPGFVGGIVEDYEYLWENYYFSTSP